MKLTNDEIGAVIVGLGMKAMRHRERATSGIPIADARYELQCAAEADALIDRYRAERGW